MNFRNLWASIEADLARARGTLPNDAQSHEAVRLYQHFLEHNELELACDMLETYAEEHEVSEGFWMALRDAATKMKSPRADRYKKNAQKAKTR
jgi:hypothetical protein